MKTANGVMSMYRYTTEDGYYSVVFEVSDGVAETYNRTHDLVSTALMLGGESSIIDEIDRDDIKTSNEVYDVLWKLLNLKTKKYRLKAPKALPLTKID